MIADVLKRETVTVAPFGALELRELSARAQIEIADAYRKDKQFEAAFIACKWGVVAWSDDSVEDISRAMPLHVANEIAGHIYRLSGFHEDAEKNSASALSVVSS
jgi:hypothetical protein